MERPGTWGSQLELMAICQSYGVLLGDGSFFLATLISCENQGEEARKGLGICCLVIFYGFEGPVG